MGAGLHVFVVEPHPIYQRGLAESLRSLAFVEKVTEASAVDEARESPQLVSADVVVLDQDLAGAEELLREIGATAGTEAIVLLSRAGRDVRDAIDAGAVGFLSKDTLTPGALAAAVQGAANGTSVIAPLLLTGLVRRRAPTPAGALPTRGDPISWLTAREQQVLSLIADGHPTREVAQRLSYSERTVKNVLHDIVTKLGARSRSQAVAHAVRDGLI